MWKQSLFCHLESIKSLSSSVFYRILKDLRTWEFFAPVTKMITDTKYLAALALGERKAFGYKGQGNLSASG